MFKLASPVAVCLAALSIFLVARDASAQLSEGAKLLTPGARAGAMGGAFVAVADDATAAVINPAGVQLLSKPQIYFEFNGAEAEPVAGFAVDSTNRASFFSAAIPVSDRLSIAITHNEPYFVSFQTSQFCTGGVCKPVEAQLAGESYSASLAVNAGAGWRLGTTISHDDFDCDGSSQYCGTLTGPTHGTSVTTGVLWQGNVVSIGASGVLASDGSPLWNRFSMGGAVRPWPQFVVSGELDIIEFGHNSDTYLTEPHFGAELQIPTGPVSWFIRGGGFTSFGSSAITDEAATVGGGLVLGTHLQMDVAYITQRHRVVFSTAVRF